MNERLSDYLLGELDDEQRDAFEAELARDPALAAEAERLRPVVTRLEALEPAAWDPPAAPRSRRCPARGAAPRRRRAARVVAPRARRAAAPGRGARARPARPRRRRRPAARRRLRRRRGQRPRARPRRRSSRSAATAHGTATLSAQDGRATVQLRGLTPNADGEFYELWLLNIARRPRRARLVHASRLRRPGRHRPAAGRPGRVRGARPLDRAGRRRPGALLALGAARAARLRELVLVVLVSSSSSST